MIGQDVRTEAIVLKRTNYGEADRILNLLTPEGKIAVLAKGVRREKSKLASGIEMFSVSEIVAHKGKGELLILTSAKSKEFFKGILTELPRLEVASEMVKKISQMAEQIDTSEYFSILKQALKAISDGVNLELATTWFYFNTVKISGEQINLWTDTEGAKLEENLKYSWNSTEKALRLNAAGHIGAKEIKMMRLMLNAKLDLVTRVKDGEKMVDELLYVAKSLNQM